MISQDVGLEIPRSEHDINDRIDEGYETKTEQHSYVWILRTNCIHIFGGSIPDWGSALTAVICKLPLSRLQNYTILGGPTSRTDDCDGQYRNIGCPKCDPYRYENSNANLFLNKPFIFGLNVRSIAVNLPIAPKLYEKNATMTGWGWTDLNEPSSWASDIQAPTISISAYDTCYAAYEGLISATACHVVGVLLVFLTTAPK